MNPLLLNIRKFISTVIELYPLPFELTTDLHTLNAYLKTYSESEELLLDGFVSRQVQKLNSKLKINDSRGTISIFDEETCGHYPSINTQKESRFMGLRLQMPTQTAEDAARSENKSCFDRNQSVTLSHRSGRNGRNEGIKTDRHKFGTRQRNLGQNNLSSLSKLNNKENVHSNSNLRGQDLLGNQLSVKDRSLKGIKSEAELLNLSSQNMGPRQNSTEIRRGEATRPRLRYQSHENRFPGNSTSLKIKLKIKSSLDLPKLKEDLSELSKSLFVQNQVVLGLAQNLQLNGQSEGVSFQ